MGKIGGNVQAVIQVMATVQNEIGENVLTWSDTVLHTGWLDLVTGESGSMDYNAKIQESTHIFLCDYVPLVYEADGSMLEITAENSRMIINGRIYEVMLYDDPMELHEQLEIYLKYLGGG